MEKLSNSLKETLGKIAKALFVDEKLIDALIKDIQRSLLSADVNVQLVFDLSKKLKERMLNEKPPKEISQKEFLVKIVYEELVNFMGKEEHGIKIEKKKPFKIMMVGLLGNGKCVHKDSKIVLSSGEIISAEQLYNRYRDKELEIEDGNIIDLENENLRAPSFNPKTLKIEDKKATKLWKLNGKPLIQVYLDNGNDFSVRVTPEHPFFVLRDGIVKKVRADELAEDDVVATPFTYKTDEKKQDLFNEIKSLDMDIKYGGLNIKRGDIQNICSNLKFKRNYCKFTTKLRNGIVPIQLIHNYDNEYLNIRSKNSKSFILFPRLLNKDLAEFLGYVIGDGHLGKDYIEISNEDPEIISRIIYLSEELFGLRVYIKEDKRTKATKHLILSSKTLVEIINKIFGIPIGKKGKNLRVPIQLQKSSNEDVRSFLRAYFDCDSSPADNARNIELTSESKALIIDTAYLLKRLGIMSAISKRVIDNVPYWRLFVTGRYAELYAKEIGFIVTHKKERANKYNLIGAIQGGGYQNIIKLDNSLKELRQRLGFSIGEIQEYVYSYGNFEKIGEISRESLTKLIALYYMKEKGNIRLILEYFKNDKQLSLSNAFVNGFVSRLKQEGYIIEDNNQIMLTEKAFNYLDLDINKEVLLEPFRSLISSDVCWIRVKKIENIGKVDYVYDLTVEDNHSFIADNIIVHNTTSIGKIAKYYSKRGYKVATLGLDVHRPAAMDQIEQVSKQVNVKCFLDKNEKNPIKIYKKFKDEYKEYDIIIIDTAGRHAIDYELIKELRDLNDEIKADENLLVMSADIGQAAFDQASKFHETCNITGVMVTKLDGTGKAGGSLAATSATKAPIKFIGAGERLDDLELFNPEGFVSRLLGMGDLKALLEKAEEAISKEDAEDLGKKFLSGEFNFIDLYESMQAMKKMGPLSKVMELIPGMGNLSIPKEMLEVQEDKLKKWKYVLQSMTKEELENPDLLDRQRIERIAKGSGTTTKEVRELLKQYKQTKKMSKLMKGLDKEKDMKKLMKKFKGKLPKGFKM